MDPKSGTMALTDTALKALKPKEIPYTVTDDRGAVCRGPFSFSGQGL